jgi:hypothetical protein
MWGIHQSTADCQVVQYERFAFLATAGLRLISFSALMYFVFGDLKNQNPNYKYQNNLYKLARKGEFVNASQKIYLKWFLLKIITAHAVSPLQVATGYSARQKSPSILRPRYSIQRQEPALALRRRMNAIRPGNS